ncbi:CyP450 monooxygenase [Auriscalpium vulgare]|uniref:CyP450 monooxygenase n=1 Tax=Auriscalpium vulgare TaxID=40419 RepID=A0ACB8S839_9AGAM|nr:CyP450 monooxygenase [Auriscalpium vulgare]
MVVDVIAAVAVLLLLRAVQTRNKKTHLPYPPGPRRLPLIKNLFDLSNTAPWVTYAHWRKQYGDVMSFEMPGQLIVVLQSPKAAIDLMDKRASIYSDRLTPPIYELANFDWMISAARYDTYWRSGRRILDRSMRPAATTKHRPVLVSKARDFLKNLLTKPEQFLEHVEFLQGSVIIRISYGYDVENSQDIILAKSRSLAHVAAPLVLPGALLVNTFPSLARLPGWLPGMGFKALAHKVHKIAEVAAGGPWDAFKDALNKGVALPSIALDEYEEQKELTEKEERDMVTSLGSLFIAGSDTTTSTLQSMFLMLALHPDVQARAQAEIDAVTGGERMPTFEDRANLPYTSALSRELLRWRVATPTGVPHRTTEDDIYEGYFIPKGTLVIVNAPAILHDPELYPDPEAFKPERFLTEDGQYKEDPLINFAFGAGKRICPARFLVDLEIFIISAMLLSTFTVSKARDADGIEVPLDAETYEGVIVRHPKKYKCAIVPRSRKAEELIMSTAQ